MPFLKGKSVRVAIPCLLILLLVAATTTWALSPFKPVPANMLNQAELDKARHIADSVFSKWRSGTFASLPDAFTAQMRQALTAQMQRSAYEQAKAMYGDYKSLSFAEAVASPSMPGTTVYRFRGSFSNSSERPEIRVVMDEAGKVGGLWIKPWATELK